MWRYVREFKVDGNVLSYRRELTVRQSRIKKRDYLRFKKFIDDVIESDKQMIHFKVEEKKEEKATEANPKAENKTEKTTDVQPKKETAND